MQNFSAITEKNYVKELKLYNLSKIFIQSIKKSTFKKFKIHNCRIFLQTQKKITQMNKNYASNEKELYNPSKNMQSKNLKIHFCRKSMQIYIKLIQPNNF